MGTPETLAGALFLGLTALSSVVIFLWKRIDAFHKDTTIKLDKCETDRADLWKKIAEMECRAQ